MANQLLLRSMSSQGTRLLTFRAAAQALESPWLVTIPAQEEIAFQSDVRDWRRVKVEWRGRAYLIARTAWESARPLKAV